MWKGGDGMIYPVLIILAIISVVALVALPVVFLAMIRFYIDKWTEA